MEVILIDYGAGNIKSIEFALERLGYSGILTSEIERIKNASKVIFPGVGEASSAMEKLRSTGLDTVIPTLTQPVLGICLGMQLMCNSSQEGNTRGLGIFDCEVQRFSEGLKVPQIGWNTLQDLKSSLFKEISEETFMYAVHSYFAPLCKHTIATTNYGLNYSSGLQRDNFYGVQFHPEKSSDVGQKILQNFLEL